jgi:hypothetical protein
VSVNPPTTIPSQIHDKGVDLMQYSLNEIPHSRSVAESEILISERHEYNRDQHWVEQIEKGRYQSIRLLFCRTLAANYIVLNVIV